MARTVCLVFPTALTIFLMTLIGLGFMNIGPLAAYLALDLGSSNATTQKPVEGTVINTTSNHRYNKPRPPWATVASTPSYHSTFGRRRKYHDYYTSSTTESAHTSPRGIPFKNTSRYWPNETKFESSTKAYPTTPSVRSNYYDSPTPGSYNHSAHYTRPTTPSVRSNYYGSPTPERYNYSAHYTPTTPSVRSNYYDSPTPGRYNHSAHYTPTTPSVRYNHSAYYTPTTPSVRYNYYDSPTPGSYNHNAHYTPTTPSVRSNYYDGPTSERYNYSAHYTRPTTPSVRSNYYDSPTPGRYNHSAYYTPTTPSVRYNHSANIGTTNGSDYTNYASNLTVNGSSNATFIKPKTPVTYDRGESMAARSNKTRPTSPIYEEDKYYTGGSKSGAYLIGYAVAERRPAPGGEGAVVDENKNGAEPIATINTTSVLATSYNGTHTAAIDKSIAPISLYEEDNSTNAGVVMPIEHTLTFYNDSYAVAKSNSTIDRNNNETGTNVTVDVGNTSVDYCNNCTIIVTNNATEDTSEERYMTPIEPPASDFVLNNVTTNNKTVDNWPIEDYGEGNWTTSGRYDHGIVPDNKNDSSTDKPRPSDGNSTISAYIDGWNSTYVLDWN